MAANAPKLATKSINDLAGETSQATTSSQSNNTLSIISNVEFKNFISNKEKVELEAYDVLSESTVTEKPQTLIPPSSLLKRKLPLVAFNSDNDSIVEIVDSSDDVQPPKRTRRANRKPPTANEAYLTFISELFADQKIPPIVLYDRKVHSSDRIYRLLNVPHRSSSFPSEDEKWFACTTPSEIPNVYRKLVKKWLTLNAENRTYHLGISKEKHDDHVKSVNF